MSEERAVGTVRWFSARRGYGFIAPDDGGEDVFVHFSAIQSTDSYRKLDEGDRVEFAVEQAEKGPQAIDVVKIMGDTGGEIIDDTGGEIIDDTGDETMDDTDDEIMGDTGGEIIDDIDDEIMDDTDDEMIDDTDDEMMGDTNDEMMDDTDDEI